MGPARGRARISAVVSEDREFLKPLVAAALRGAGRTPNQAD
jgi:hypothetical protein